MDIFVLKLLELFPIFALLIVSILDFGSNSDHSTYFHKPRTRARKEVTNKLNVESSRLDEWSFICFKEMLVRKSQTLFLATINMQLFVSALSYFIQESYKKIDGNPAIILSAPSMDSFFTLIVLLIILSIAMIYGAYRSQPFAWYYPRCGMYSREKKTRRAYLSFYGALIGRFTLIAFIMSIVWSKPKAIQYFSSAMPNNWSTTSNENWIVIAAAIIVAIAVLATGVIQHLTKTPRTFNADCYLDEKPELA